MYDLIWRAQYHLRRRTGGRATGARTGTYQWTDRCFNNSGKCTPPPPDLEVLRPCRPRPPEDDKGGDDNKRDQQNSGTVPSPTPDPEVLRPCHPGTPEDDKGGDDNERGRQNSGTVPSPTPDPEVLRPCRPGPPEDDEEGDNNGRGQPSSGEVPSPSRDGSPSRRESRIQRPKGAEPGPVLQGVVDCLTSISNQMLRLSGRSGKNGGWPWFDGTFRGYPAFKRKWQDYEKNHLSLTPQQDLVRLFRENCMNQKIGSYIRVKMSMAEAWERLDMLYDDPLIFTRELIKEVLEYSEIKNQEYEKLFNYYCTVEHVIKEADKAGIGMTFLNWYNINEMTHPLPAREAELWREAKGRIQLEDLSPIFIAFVRERLEWSANQSQEVRKIPPKPIPPAASATRSENERKKATKGKRNADQAPLHKGVRNESPRPGHQPGRGKAGVQTQWKIKRDCDAAPLGPTRRSCVCEACQAEQAQDDQPAPTAQDSAESMGVNSVRSFEEWPRFDGTCAGYPAFKREWKSKRKHLRQQISQEETLRIFRKKCLDNPQAGLIGKAGSMSEAWAMLDGVFGDPTAESRRLIEGFKTLPRFRSKKDQRELYALIQDVLSKATRQESEDLLLIPSEIGKMLRPLPQRERDRWFTTRVNSAPEAVAGTFIAFIKDQWERVNTQQRGEQGRPAECIPAPAPDTPTTRQDGTQSEQGETLQVNNESGETPRRACKKPAGRQTPSQQSQLVTSQTPMGKRGRMECSQGQTTGHATIPFQTTRPP
jgi:hypothetical protein